MANQIWSVNKAEISMQTIQSILLLLRVVVSAVWDRVCKFNSHPGDSRYLIFAILEILKQKGSLPVSKQSRPTGQWRLNFEKANLQSTKGDTKMRVGSYEACFSLKHFEFFAFVAFPWHSVDSNLCSFFFPTGCSAGSFGWWGRQIPWSYGFQWKSGCHCHSWS